MATEFSTFDSTAKQLKLDVDVGGTKSEYVYDLASGNVSKGGTVLTAGSELEAVSAEITTAAQEYISKAPRAEAAAVEEMGLVKGLLDKGIANGTASAQFKNLQETAVAASQLKAKIAALPADRVVTQAELKEIKTLMAQEPHAVNLLAEDVASYNKLFIDSVAGKTDALLDRKALEAGVKKLTTGIEEVNTLHASGKYDADALRKILLKDPELIDAVPASLKAGFKAAGVPGKTALDFDVVANALKTDISKHTTEIEKLTKNVLNAQERLAGSKFLKTTAEKDVAEGVKKIENYLSKNSDFKSIMETHVNTTFSSTQLSTLGEAKGLKSALPNLGKTVEAAGEKASKSFGSFFKKSPENLKKMAEKEGVALEKLKGFKTLNTGTQVGIIAGAALILGSAFGAFGKKKEAGKYTQAEADRQNAVPEAAPAR